MGIKCMLSLSFSLHFFAFTRHIFLWQKEEEQHNREGKEEEEILEKQEAQESSVQATDLPYLSLIMARYIWGCKYKYVKK